MGVGDAQQWHEQKSPCFLCFGSISEPICKLDICSLFLLPGKSVCKEAQGWRPEGLVESYLKCFALQWGVCVSEFWAIILDLPGSACGRSNRKILKLAEGQGNMLCQSEQCERRLVILREASEAFMQIQLICKFYRWMMDCPERIIISTVNHETSLAFHYTVDWLHLFLKVLDITRWWKDLDSSENQSSRRVNIVSL